MRSEATATGAPDQPHPDIERLKAFDRGDLREGELGEIGAHLDGCGACRAVLDSLAADSRFLAQVRAAAEPGGVVQVEESQRRQAVLTLLDSGLRRRDQERPTLPFGNDAQAGDVDEPVFPKSLGPYDLLEEVGRGGMGVVYRARHRDLNRTVALKMIRAGRFASGDDWERFRLEAGFAARVQHPHIIHLYDVGIQEGQRYLALEWAEGGTLGGRLDGVPWSPVEAARLVEDLALAVQESHRQGVIHRDLKPDNVLLQIDRDRSVPTPGRGGSRGERLDGFIPKITDFGLAAAIEGNDGLTQTGIVMGTPEYMAPEQAASRSSAVGPATDIHALGAIFYELLTGRPPFRAATMLQTLELVSTAEPVSPSRLQPGLPRDAEVICLKCLEKSPARRYATAQDLAEDLRRFMSHESILARPSRPWQRAARWCARNPAVSALSAAFTAALVVGLAVIVWKWREAETERRNVVVAERATARQLVRAVEARSEAVRTRNDSQRVSANFAINRSLELAGRGETGAASLWMLEALKLAPEDDRALPLMIRRNLTAWSRRINALTQIFEHPNAVTRVAISPDGKTALTGCLDTKARLWDLDTGRAIGEPWECNAVAECVAFRPDGLVAVTGGTIARLRDARTGKPVGRPMPHPRVAFRAAFRQDGKQLLTTFKGDSVLLWDAATGEPKGRVGPPGRSEWIIFCADYSADGRSIVVGMMDPSHLAGESGVQRWDIESGKPIGPLLRLPTAVLDVACSRDGRHVLTACAGGTCQVWDAGTLAPAGPPMVHPALVEPAIFSADGKSIFTGCSDGLARRWDVASGRQVGEALLHHSAIWGIASDRSGRLALTGSADHFARLWELATDPDPGPPTTGAAPAPPPEMARRMPRVIYSLDRRLVLSGDHRGGVKLVELATGASVGKPMRLPAGAVRVLALDPGGSRIAASSDAPGAPLAQLWHASGRPLATLPGAGGGAIAMAFNPAGTVLAIIDGRHHILFWNTATGKPLAADPSFTAAAYQDLAFTRDGRTLAAATDWGPSVRRWHINAGEPYGTRSKDVFPNAPGTSRVAISPDGTRISAVSTKAVRLFNAADGREIAVPVMQSNSLLDAAFSADGKLVISLCEKGDVRVWDIAAGEQLGPSLGHPSDVIAADVGLDSRFLVAVCRDGTAQLWDLATSRPIGPPISSRTRILGASLLPDGRGIATTDDDGTTRVSAIPLPIAGDLTTLTVLYQVRTAQRLDRHQTLTGLVPSAWRACLAQLKSLESGDRTRLPRDPASSGPDAPFKVPSR